MSYDVVFREPTGETTGYLLCTISTLKALGDWAAKLEDTGQRSVSAIKSLFVNGYADDSRVLAEQLDALVGNPHVIPHELRKTIDMFHKNLGRGLPGETVEIEE